MLNRLLIVAGTALAFVGPTCAQAPEGAPAVPPPASMPQPTTPAATWAPAWCAPSGQFWVSGRYIAAWFSGDKLPPLVTTSPPGTAQAAAGVLNLSTTSVLFGSDTANFEMRSGLGLDAGYWFDPERRWGIEAGTTVLESQATLFSASSDGSTILARPFFNITHGQDSSLIAFPGVSSGNVDVKAASGNFYEGHVDLTETFADNGWLRLESILGYRFYHYDEGLRIRQTVNPLGAAFVQGTQVASQDDFNTRNAFNGGDLGLRAQLALANQLSLGLVAKVAIGNLNRDVSINGSTVTTVPGAAPVTQVGGIYALSSNIGSHGSRDWEVLPDFGIHLSWQATSNLWLTAGYSALFLDQIARSADQVDFHINPNFFPSAVAPSGPSLPAFNLVRRDMWVQSLNLGVELRY
jgi:hypothetical protein